MRNTLGIQINNNVKICLVHTCNSASFVEANAN